MQRDLRVFYYTAASNVFLIVGVITRILMGNRGPLTASDAWWLVPGGVTALGAVFTLRPLIHEVGWNRVQTALAGWHRKVPYGERLRLGLRLLSVSSLLTIAMFSLWLQT